MREQRRIELLGLGWEVRRLRLVQLRRRLGGQRLLLLLLLLLQRLLLLLQNLQLLLQ